MNWKLDQGMTDQINKFGADVSISSMENRQFSKGFSLVEMMVGMAVSSVVACLILTLFIGFQKMSNEISASLDTRDTLRLAPVLLGRWVKGAGMNLPSGPAEYLEIDEGSIGVESDFRGDNGEPDGDTDDNFEDITIKVIRNELKLKSGKGSFQPVLKHLDAMTVEQEGESFIRLHLSGRKNRLQTNTSVIESHYFLWNPGPNLFPKEMQ